VDIFGLSVKKKIRYNAQDAEALIGIKKENEN